jgi:hypothetical protein
LELKGLHWLLESKYDINCFLTSLLNGLKPENIILNRDNSRLKGIENLLNKNSLFILSCPIDFPWQLNNHYQVLLLVRHVKGHQDDHADVQQLDR